MNNTPQPGELCLVILPAIDAGKLVKALQRIAPPDGFRMEPHWYVEPPIPCRCTPIDGIPSHMDTRTSRRSGC